MQRGATSSGTVTAADTHEPFEEVTVCAYRAGSECHCATTAGDGSY
jgi:hypothetical protein